MKTPTRIRTRARPRLRRPRVTGRSGSQARGQAARAQVRARVADTKLLVPSSLTILAICAGLSAVKFGMDGKVDLAVAMIAASALLDGVDGRVARLLGATTKIGAELDSLADAINFGVAPALTLYTVSLHYGDRGWIFALIYCIAIVLRLARFNTLIDDDNAPGYTKDYFVGVPAPAAALIALLPIGLEQEFGRGWWTSLGAVGCWMLFSAFLAVSRIPTASLKSYRIPPNAMVLLLIAFAGAAALLLTFPYVLMMGAIAVYLVHIPFAWRTQRWVRQRPETWDSHPRERRAERRATREVRRARRPQRSVARLGLRRPGRGIALADAAHESDGEAS
ncbi:CDP-alcohol phosphatidyltransferase family protein [Jongsikchunia kroppenstedtii]|uniref:CDP-alcohol phosphatidyltransferase family protein n=1 Tax=Jongsikchunia kroppenstedtii TaxID=1121721 RepID=UPI00037B0066